MGRAVDHVSRVTTILLGRGGTGEKGTNESEESRE